MLPTESGIQVISWFDVEEQPSKTYYLDKKNKRIVGIVTDYLKAIEQAVYLILSTERYDYVMYSWNYGIELKDLYGQIKEYVIPNLINRIKEALLQDDRIMDVVDFNYKINKNVYSISFTVITEYGNIDISEVEFSVWKYDLWKYPWKFAEKCAIGYW